MPLSHAECPNCKNHTPVYELAVPRLLPSGEIISAKVCNSCNYSEDAQLPFAREELEVALRRPIFAAFKEALYAVMAGKIQCTCGKHIFSENDLQLSWPGTDDGLEIPYKDQKFWLVAHCPECQYDLAAWKFGSRIVRT